jgi:acyl carrier protein
LKLDFFALCSSLSSLIGGYALVDYAAANAFLDAFAEASSNAGWRTTAIDWDTWTEVGMLVDMVLPGHLEARRKEHLKEGILTSEGGAAFALAVGSGQPRIAVSTRDLALRIGLSRKHDASASTTDEVETAEPAPIHSRPALGVAYSEPRTNVERKIAAIWRELLGVERVGIHDDFLALGGHSLLAIQLISRLRAEFQVALSMDTVFKAPTVAELAATIEQFDSLTSYDDKIALALEEIEQVSDGDLEALLAQTLDRPS